MNFIRQVFESFRFAWNALTQNLLRTILSLTGVTIGIFAIIAVVVSRMIIVYPLVKFRNAVSSNDIPAGWSHILFWGGLKGSISIALVVCLPPEFPYRSLFLTTTFSIVLFTLIVQGLTIRPLSKLLKL